MKLLRKLYLYEKLRFKEAVERSYLRFKLPVTFEDDDMLKKGEVNEGIHLKYSSNYQQSVDCGTLYK